MPGGKYGSTRPVMDEDKVVDKLEEEHVSILEAFYYPSEWRLRQQGKKIGTKRRFTNYSRRRFSSLIWE